MYGRPDLGVASVHPTGVGMIRLFLQPEKSRKGSSHLSGSDSYTKPYL